MTRINTHAKGSRWRRQVQTWFDEQGYYTHARMLGEAGDDISVRSPTVDLNLSIEAKNHKAITLASFVDQCCANAGGHELPVVFIKRKGRSSVDDGYVVMDAATYRRHLEHMTP